MVKQADRRAQTRDKLLSAAQELFVRKGYADSSTEDILSATGLSKGALYHHFGSKEEIFTTLYETAAQDSIAAAARKAPRAETVLETLAGQVLAWLAELRDPVLASLLLDQGPQVLGWQKARAIEYRYSLAAIRQGLEAAARAGEIALPHPDITAHMLNALITEAALLLMERPDEADALEAEIRRFITNLRTAA